MKQILLILFFIQFTLLCNSQTSKVKSNKNDTIPKYRFEVGTDLLWLIDKNSLPGYSLQLKIHNKSKKHSGAWRFKVGMDLQTRDTIDAGTIVPSDNYWHTQNTIFYFRPGYQLNYNFKNLQIFWGADLHFYYNNLYKDYFDGLILMNDKYYSQYFEKKLTEWQFGFVTLAGATCFITPRISISLETNASMIYSSIKNREDSYYKGLPKGDNQSNWYDYNTFSIKFIPIFTINLNIHF